MVTGGSADGYDTTEVLFNNDWVTVSGKLPTGMYDLRAITFRNRVMVFGKN